jgi:GH25 family lysozyme M1 (1,4-beta-N-acetylmuramidase)
VSTISEETALTTPEIAADTAWLEEAALPVASAQGVDVSNFQGRYSWSATTGLSFGIYRMTQGLGTSGANSPDPDAQWNHDQIMAKGLHHGAYHFLDPAESGAAQAQYFVTRHKAIGLGAADMLWLDNETAGSSPAAVAACAREFMAELDTLCPHNPRGVYTYISFSAEGNCAGLAHYPLWLAYPAAAAPKPPPPWAKWTFWQYGLRNGVDADAFNGTAADLTAWIRSFIPPPPWQETALERAKALEASLAAVTEEAASLTDFVTNHQ